MNTIISDTTTLIVLSKLDRYDLLKNIFEKVFIPKVVITELSKKTDGISKKILECSFFQIKEISDRRLFTLLSDMLDKGESEAKMHFGWFNSITIRYTTYKSCLNLTFGSYYDTIM